MGCTSSKLDDLPAVALCRQRCLSLEEAIHHRYALAEAHVAYIQSLKLVGHSLHHLIDQDLDNSIPPPSPLLPLPTQRKGDPVLTTTDASFSPPPAAVPYHSHSNSGSHLHFHSDSDDDDGDSGSLHHSGHSSPLHSHDQFHHDYNDQDTLSSFPGGGGGGGGGGFTTMNFMKNRATPSVAYEQRPMNPEETVRMGESSYYPYSDPNQNPSSNQYYGYPNYGGGIGGFFPYGSSSPPPPAAAPASASSSKPPPPPPSPPRNTTWDFLNPFDTFERYYPSYAPSPDPNKVRQEEGIPDLEDVDYQHEVVKEVHGKQKFVAGDGNYSKMADDEDGRGKDGEALYQTRPSVPVGIEGAEYEVHLVDKNVDANKERGNVAAFKAQGGSRGVSEVVTEIQAQFERASESGNEVSKMLEVGKLPYHRKNAVYQVSSKMLHVITPSLSVVSSQSQPSTSTSAEASSSAEKAGSIYLDFDEDAGMRSGNLSSTLKKLSMWEKKLYDEVKAEEKMRIIHERKRRRLTRLDERGAEAQKIDSTRALIRTLSTKIRIAIQVVDKISVKINKLRDEELWPQINELIPGIIRMWKVMLECHRNQCQAITEAKSLDAIASNKKPSDAHLEAIMQLGLELINWISRFSSWIGSQKGFINALNAWLLKCILYEPEETPDGIAPFSPGRIGAPPVFVICNQWSQAMERISEKEVVDAMRVFAVSVFQLWERQNMGMRQKLMANKDSENKSKTLERREQKIQKAMQALDKKMVLVSGEGSWLPIHGQIVHQRDNTNMSSLQSGLKQIFETMERFTANSMQAYEELWVRSEEDRLARENAKVP